MSENFEVDRQRDRLAHASTSLDEAPICGRRIDTCAGPKSVERIALVKSERRIRCRLQSMNQYNSASQSENSSFKKHSMTMLTRIRMTIRQFMKRQNPAPQFENSSAKKHSIN
jgi:hypothetical protein